LGCPPCGLRRGRRRRPGRLRPDGFTAFSPVHEREWRQAISFETFRTVHATGSGKIRGNIGLRDDRSRGTWSGRPALADEATTMKRDYPARGSSVGLDYGGEMRAMHILA